MSSSYPTIPRNVPILCAMVSDGGIDWDQFAVMLADELDSELERHKLRLAKRVAKISDASWQDIQKVTGVRRAADCRQAVINGRFPEASRSIRQKVIARDGRRCVYCGSTRHVVVDHIVPRSRGGRNVLTNLQALCTRCNIVKGSR